MIFFGVGELLWRSWIFRLATAWQHAYNLFIQVGVPTLYGGQSTAEGGFRGTEDAPECAGDDRVVRLPCRNRAGDGLTIEAWDRDELDSARSAATR